MSFDKFALGLVGALQAAQQNDLRQQEMEKANKLLEMQLRNSAVDADYKRAHADYFRSMTQGASGYGDLMGELAGLLSPGATPNNPAQPPAPKIPGSRTEGEAVPGSTPVSFAPGQIKDTLDYAQNYYQLPPNLIHAVVGSENPKLNPNATSSAGARGIMQMMPGTFAEMGGRNITDPQDNIMAGAKYLRQMLDKYNGDPALALAAYNAGPGAVDKHGGIPPYAETQDYVPKTLRSAGLPLGSFELAAKGGTASDAPPGYGGGQRPPALSDSGVAAVEARLRELETKRQQGLSVIGKKGLPRVYEHDAATRWNQMIDRERDIVTRSYSMESQALKHGEAIERQRVTSEMQAAKYELAQAASELKQLKENRQAAHQENQGRMEYNKEIRNRIEGTIDQITSLGKNPKGKVLDSATDEVGMKNPEQEKANAELDVAKNTAMKAVAEQLYARGILTENNLKAVLGSLGGYFNQWARPRVGDKWDTDSLVSEFVANELPTFVASYVGKHAPERIGELELMFNPQEKGLLPPEVQQRLKPKAGNSPGAVSDGRLPGDAEVGVGGALQDEPVGRRTTPANPLENFAGADPRPTEAAVQGNPLENFDPVPTASKTQPAAGLPVREAAPQVKERVRGAAPGVYQSPLTQNMNSAIDAVAGWRPWGGEKSETRYIDNPELNDAKYPLVESLIAQPTRALGSKIQAFFDFFKKAPPVTQAVILQKYPEVRTLMDQYAAGRGR